MHQLTHPQVGDADEMLSGPEPSGGPLGLLQMQAGELVRIVRMRCKAWSAAPTAHR